MSETEVLGGIPTIRIGLNYLVPTTWWQKFYLSNRNRNLSQFQIPPLQILDYLDPFLLDYKHDLIDDLEYKSNYLKFQSIKISPQPLKQQQWTPINPAIWSIIAKHNQQSNGIFTIVQESKHIDSLDLTQLQIIFCSKNRSDAFVGFVPKQATMSSTVRQIGYQMGFIEVVKTKASFLDKNSEMNYSLHQLQNYTVNNAPGTILMAFNMQRTEEQNNHEINIFEKLANESNEAVVGEDLVTMVDDSNRLNEPINRTMSTGAQTPFSLVFSQGFDLDRQYRVKELFGAKQPEEIEELKLLADQKIQNEKSYIGLPEGDDQSLQLRLQKMAEELLDGFLKKKTCKQKQVQLYAE